ncbi:MAG: ABC transporter permease [Candidatus Uhrbacteria bacterium]|nr:ABC transporter permease [Candidatus Uhrbacteria bacterium]
MKWSDLLETSSTSLKTNKSRSILTILGIVIGIAAVIIMFSVGRSAEGLILNQVADLGADLVFIEPAAGDPTAGPPDPFIERSLDIDDVDALEKVAVFSSITPILQSTSTVSREQESTFTQVIGTTEGYIDVFPSEVLNGRFLDESDVGSYARVAVLGSEIAVDLFGDQDPIGERIKIKSTSLRVIGVFPEQGTRFFQNLDTQIAVPITTAQRDIFGVDHVTYISARAIGDIDNAKDEARFTLRDTHNLDNPEGVPEKDDFFVSSQSDAVEIIGVVGSVLSLLLVSIAAISLVVGGIGIMNIMLVSVTERTKEIGLRKSVGATYKEILQQFLLEAVLLTMFGGIIGVVLGVVFSVVASYAVGYYLDGWEPTVPISAVFLGVFVATTVGVVFGIYPARRAAKLDPIEALRYE